MWQPCILLEGVYRVDSPNIPPELTLEYYLKRGRALIEGGEYT